MKGRKEGWITCGSERMVFGLVSSILNQGEHPQGNPPSTKHSTLLFGRRHGIAIANTTEPNLSCSSRSKRQHDSFVQLMWIISFLFSIVHTLYLALDMFVLSILWWMSFARLEKYI